MARHGNPLSPGETANFHAAVLKALPHNIKPELARRWTRNGKKLTGALRRTLCAPFDPVPYELTLNGHGHLEITMMGLDISGSEEVELAWATEEARSCLRYAGPGGYETGSYDAKTVLHSHHLTNGKAYRVVLVPAGGVSSVSELYLLASERQRVRFPAAGLAPRIREAVSDVQMEIMGLQNIIVPHVPVANAEGKMFMLGVQLREDGSWLHAFRHRSPTTPLNDGDALALVHDELT